MEEHEGPDQEEIALREWLAALGATPDQIAAAERERNPDGLASDLVLSRGATFSARDVERQTGLDVPAVLAIYRDLGVSIPDPDAPQFTDDDVALISKLSWAAENGFSTGPGLLRVVAGAIERIAEAAVAVYVQGPEEEMRRRHASALEHTQKNASATELVMKLGVGLAPLFRHHRRSAVNG